jgi:hypothetical protein
MNERRRIADLERLHARQAAIEEEEKRQLQAEQRRQQQEEEEKKKKDKIKLLLIQRQLEEKHFGPKRKKLKKSQSLPILLLHCIHRDSNKRSMNNSIPCHNGPSSMITVPVFHHPKKLKLFISMAQERAKCIGNRHHQDTTNMQEQYHSHSHPNGLHHPFVATAMVASTSDLNNGMITQLETIHVKEIEECAICLELMEVGNAIFTTACAHSFHWGCLKEIQRSDVSNADKCPACRAIMEEMQVKKQCDHPRVRTGHRFCRDCGQAVTEADVKPRPSENPSINTTAQTTSTPPPTSYRANAQGALVRCPQCQIQMRVLPHMYNMRVACPSGHMFLVQVAGHGSNSHRGTNTSTTGSSYNRVESNVSSGIAGPTPRLGNINAGYPGFYRSTNSYSEL